ncbi:hypothetical protein MMC25_005481 [Agyrium rufum]|nr:hypothetical protein [Agyrium rufum]
MPTRVLDVGGHSSTLRLVITDGLKADWVALSHCWGTTARFVTTKGNIDDYAQHLNLTDLPPTFQDAINVTRTLGYKYLWIDSLCIIQDSHGDWTREAGQMQRYYKHAILTINADSAAGDHEGFLSHARQSDRDAFCIPFKANGLGPCQAYIRKSFRNSLWHEESPLSQRAWTLQEDLLSPRTIHYNAGELNWECQKHRIVESDATPLGTDDAAFSVLNKRHFLKPETAAEDPLVIRYPGFRYHFQPLERWYILFEDYCRREITFNSDRLPAIAGLARELSQQGSLTYMAGLWKEDLHTSLAWSVDSRGESVEKYLAPSWSWASLKINVHWGSNVYPAFELYGKVRNWLPDLELPHAECLDYSLGLEGDDPYGRLRSGRLRLKGRMLSFADWAGKSPTHFNTYWRNVKSHLYWYFRAPGVHPPDALDQMICSLDVDPGFDDEDESYDQLDISPKTEQKKSIEAGEQAQHDPLPQYIEGTLAESVSNASLSDSIQNCETDSVAATWDPSVLNSVYLFQIAIFKPYGNDKNHQSKRLCYALMLKAVDTTPGAFRRVGLAEVPIITGLAEVGWEKSIINIL